MQESETESPIREKTAALTSATYRVTALLPVDEPLSKKIREAAVEILAGVLEFLAAGKKGVAVRAVIVKIETMQEYMRLAGSLQGVNPHTSGGVGVNPLNFAVLEREYAVLAGFFEGGADEEKEEEVKDRKQEKRETVVMVPSAQLRGEPDGVSERQKVILVHINQVEQAKISDFSSLFGGISVKTIQRELQDLVAKNILRKEGEKRWTVYVRNDVR